MWCLSPAALQCGAHRPRRSNVMPTARGAPMWCPPPAALQCGAHRPRRSNVTPPATLSPPPTTLSPHPIYFHPHPPSFNPTHHTFTTPTILSPHPPYVHPHPPYFHPIHHTFTPTHHTPPPPPSYFHPHQPYFYPNPSRPGWHSCNDYICPTSFYKSDVYHEKYGNYCHKNNVKHANHLTICWIVKQLGNKKRYSSRLNQTSHK